ncbi:hypothetical protein BDN72DRAFT_76722 [Pluteus cervinus]|uniref:Uncharacterized protein n=1 Tax=Pluteus cervinus TaxID=181527 RepID=A0ACD3B996_9AGAR|nr:hypothetical protein BDN72DRAFT_76722 [Pluteus cervinus]
MSLPHTYKRSAGLWIIVSLPPVYINRLVLRAFPLNLRHGFHLPAIIPLGYSRHLRFCYSFHRGEARTPHLLMAKADCASDTIDTLHQTSPITTLFNIINILLKIYY